MRLFLLMEDEQKSCAIWVVYLLRVTLKRDSSLVKQVGWAVFLPTIKAEPRWAEKIAHPTSYKLTRLK